MVQKSRAPQIRDFFVNQYGGRCQICDQTFPRREDGQPYFEAVYLISHAAAAWTDEPGSVLCLCAQCSAKWQHGSVECPDETDRLRKLQPESESGVKPALQVRLIGKEENIRFTDRHLIEVQELLSHGSSDPVPAGSGKAPDASPTPSTASPDSFVNCPHCKAPIKQRNLDKHIRKVHHSGLKMLTHGGASNILRRAGLRRLCIKCGKFGARPGEDFCNVCKR